MIPLMKALVQYWSVDGTLKTFEIQIPALNGRYCPGGGEIRHTLGFPPLKGTQRIPKSYLPSLATCCEKIASHLEQIMEKTGKLQTVYAGPTNLSMLTNLSTFPIQLTSREA